jgi:hypothetical protein
MVVKQLLINHNTELRNVESGEFCREVRLGAVRAVRSKNKEFTLAAVKKWLREWRQDRGD